MLVTFQIHSAEGPFGDLIKKVSDGDKTHVSIRLTEGDWDYVWEARFGKKIKAISWKDYSYKDSIKNTIIFEVYEKNRISAMLNWLRKQEGKGYDWLGVISFIWFWIKPKKGKWYCSELAGTFLFKFIVGVEKYDQKITPYGFESLALLVKKLLGT